VWKMLGVDSIEVKEAELDPITNEHIKATSGYLRGTIAKGLEDTGTGALDPSDTQLTRFHSTNKMTATSVTSVKLKGSNLPAAS
jgi:sulfite reductase (NADPH) hemoprotein beta-component